VTILYPYHPDFGGEFVLVGVYPNGIIRCSNGDKLLEVPEWMTDPVLCAKVKAVERPVCDIPALQEINRLVVALLRGKGGEN
jgi:hypothetical protein